MPGAVPRAHTVRVPCSGTISTPCTGWLGAHHLSNSIDLDSVLSEMTAAPSKCKEDTPLNKHN